MNKVKGYIEIINGSLIYHVEKNNENEIDEGFKEFLKEREIQIVYDK